MAWPISHILFVDVWGAGGRQVQNRLRSVCLVAFWEKLSPEDRQ